MNKKELKEKLIERLENINNFSTSVYTYKLNINDTIEDLKHREEWK